MPCVRTKSSNASPGLGVTAPGMAQTTNPVLIFAGLDILPALAIEFGIMDCLKGLMVMIAAVVPLAVLVLLFWIVMKDRKTDWKLATCLSGLAVATSLVVLLGSGRLSFLRYGDAMVQVNEKAEETRKLTDQNKRLAKLTADAISEAASGAIMGAGFDASKLNKALEQLRKEAEK
jgi:predicted signal transduction protein with EAL and GGDEF domain